MSLIAPVSVVLEGLDGVGKTTVAQVLAMRLSASHKSTPPEQMRSYRSWFTTQEDTAMRKAYYMVGNFMAGNDMKTEVDNGRSIVVDRYYASTMSYIHGKTNIDEPVPDSSDTIFSWPVELYKPDFMFVLVLPETDRVARRASRVTVAENAEEKMLRENPRICERINAMYARFGCTVVNITATESVDEVAGKLYGLIVAAQAQKSKNL